MGGKDGTWTALGLGYGAERAGPECGEASGEAG
jgi:hypothetical protein